MEKLLKLYKMFYRLLRLKSEQRREIERRIFCDFLYCNRQDRSEQNRLKQEVFNWEFMALKYGAKTPQELDDIIEEIVERKHKRNCPNCAYKHELYPINYGQVKVFCEQSGHWLTWNLKDNCTCFIDEKEA